VSLLVCYHLDLSSKGHPTSRYATISTALRIIQSLKPHHYIKLGIPSVENVGTLVRWGKSCELHTPLALSSGKDLIKYKGQETKKGARATLDMVVKNKKPCPCWELNPDHPGCSPVL
jgi:hypothetical protein